MTLSKYYNWDRYWKPATAKEPLTFDKGFLVEKNDYDNTHLKLIEELETKDYLILIGEPGIGKTKTIERYQEILNNRETPTQDSVYLFKEMKGWDKADMKSFFDDELKKELENSDKTIYLYLDSLDECRLTFKAAATCLVNQLNKLSNFKNRLKLRVTCRTADLPDKFINDLSDYYKESTNNKNEENVYELCPLTKEQVIEAANYKHIDDVEKFMEALINSDAIPFAIKPITLDFLLVEYKERKEFSKNIIDLFKSGIENLLAEPNIYYKEVRRNPDLLPNQKITIAARIASISIFGNLTKIAKNAELTGNSNEKTITFDTISGNEHVKETAVDLTIPNIDAVLQSALFSFYDSATLAFSHKSYAEFLTAYYLHENEVPLKVVHDYFYNDLNKVHPQLKEVAVWYTHFSPEFLDDLIQRDCSILLDKNTNHISDENKEMLIDRYIVDLNEGKVEYKSKLKGLVYDGLNRKIFKELQNKPTDSTKSFLIDLAHFSKNKELLVKAIFNLLSTMKLIYLKRDVLIFIDRHGNDETKKKLIPILKRKNTFEHDVEDQLRGDILTTIYKLLDFEKLLPFITNQKNESLIGS